jgi:hypothetical protein
MMLPERPAWYATRILTGSGFADPVGAWLLGVGFRSIAAATSEQSYNQKNGQECAN